MKVAHTIDSAENRSKPEGNFNTAQHTDVGYVFDFVELFTVKLAAVQRSLIKQGF